VSDVRLSCEALRRDVTAMRDNSRRKDEQAEALRTSAEEHAATAAAKEAAAGLSEQRLRAEAQEWRGLTQRWELAHKGNTPAIFTIMTIIITIVV
jgi:hypothetical protein